VTARILVLDIETSPNLAWVWGLWQQNVALNQLEQTGNVISFAAKWHGEKGIQFYSDHHDGHEAMVRAAWDLLDEADIVVHYNGTSFDIPHLNREFALAGFKPPKPYKQVDLLQVARKQFRFASNKLDHVSRELGVGGKVQTGGFDLWLACLAGDDLAWAKMRRYNINDVKITEKVYDALLPWITNHPHVGLYGDTTGDCCGRCGGTVLVRRGYAYTPLGKFQIYRCKGCGGWSRGRSRLDGVDARPTG
jgi:DNA polymerase elongation subunit (family B)